jgi:multimeric flavodoxin WrbA
MIQLLGISGSPRRASTDFVVREALDYAVKEFNVQTDYFPLQNKNINFCRHCDYCVREKQGCIQQDDMLAAYAKMEKADAFFDRCRALVAANSNALKNKVGAGVAVGGDRLGGQELALLTIHSFYLANKMIPTSGGAFGANLGGTIWSHDLGRQGAQEDSEGLKTVHKTVTRLLELATTLKGVGCK